MQGSCGPQGRALASAQQEGAGKVLGHVCGGPGVHAHVRARVSVASTRVRKAATAALGGRCGA
eukprot:149869-Chlamydomonas_euryale.AAC.1